MHIHGILAQSGGIGDFADLEIFDESQQKNGPLSIGESARRIPDRANLLIDCCPLFRGYAAVRPFMEFVTADAGCFSPELESSIARVIPDEVHRDSHEPGMDAAFAPKTRPSF